VDGRAVRMVGNRQDIIGVGIARDPPGILALAACDVAPDMFRVLVGL